MPSRMPSLARPARALRVLVALVLAAAVHARGGELLRDPKGDWQLTQYTMRQGLPQDWVTSIAQTDEGFLWIGTHGGLARFDGASFLVHDLSSTPELPSNRIERLFTASNGDLWIVPSQASPVRLRDGVFERFGDRPEAPSWGASDVAEDADGNLWFAGHRLVRWDGEAFEAVPVGGLEGSDVRPTSLHLARDGVLWAATAAGVAWLEDGSWNLCERPAGLPSPSVVSESKRGIWAAGSGRFSYVRDGRLVPTELDGPPLGSVLSVLFDTCGITWIGTSRHLLRLVERELPDGSWSASLVEAPPGGLSATTGVAALFEDDEGNLWISRDGLLRLRQQPFVSFPLPDRGRPYPLITHTDAAGETSFVTATGSEDDLRIVRLRDGAWEPYFHWGARGKIRHLAASSDGGLWISSTDKLLSKLRDGRLESWSHGLARLLGIHEAPDGVLWLLTSTGLHLLRDGELETLDHPNAPDVERGRSMSVTWTDAGNLLAVWPHVALRMTPDGEATYLVAGHDLPDLPMRAMQETSDGALWISTYGGGLVRWLDGETTILTKREGLPDNSLGGLLPDAQGHLWVNSNFGLFRIPLADLTAFAERSQDRVRVRLVNDAEGDGHEAGELPDGRLWFRTTNSICVLDPAKITGELPPPRIVIEGVLANHEVLDHGGPVVVPSGSDLLRIRFSVVSMTSPGQLNVRTRLEGHHAGWVESEGARIAHYANVAPGKYTFLVEACSADGSWRDAAARLDVEVEPFAWQTPWFKALVVAIVAGALVLLHLLRTRAIRQRNARMESEIVRRRRAEEALRLQADRLQMALSSADMGTWHWDPELDVAKFDASLARILGLPERAATLRTEDYTAHFHPEDREAAFAIWERAIAERVDLVREYRIVRVNGEVCWVRERGRPHYAPTGELEYVTGACLDITDLREAEEQRRELEDHLRQAHKMEAIGQLAAGVAHEFNNLLVGILCNAELVLESDDGQFDAKTNKRVRDISRCSERAAALTHKLLSFAKRDTTARSTFSLNDVVLESESMLRGVVSERVTFDIDLEPDLPTVEADRSHVEQGLINLVLNARDAVDGDGRVTIRSSTVVIEAADQAAYPGVRPGEYAALAVSDDGCGMDARTLERVFEPFFTTKPTGEGTGLGLSTLFADMANNGGHVTAESRPGEGSTFRMLLPLERAATNGRGGARSDAERRPEDGTILVCDDDRAVLSTLAAVLSGEGYRVLEARGADEARVLARQHEGRIDLLLIDVRMPGSNGPQLAEELVAEDPDLLVLYMSGYPGEVLRVEGREFEFVKKPPTRSTLLRRVRDVLARPVEL